MYLEMAVASFGPNFPSWALTFTPSEDERREALEAFGEPEKVVGSAQFQISKDGGSYYGRKLSWTISGPVRADSLTALARRMNWRKAEAEDVLD